MINSSRSPLSTPINAAEPCSLPKGCPPFYFCHRRNVIKLKLVDLEHQVYLHTVLSNSGSKLTDRPSYLNHTCRILQPKILFPNFIHNFIIYNSHYSFNPLSLKSDKHQISPCNINVL